MAIPAVPKTSRVKVVLSGGLDSTVALARAVSIHGKENVSALTFNYGQGHEREILSAARIALHYEVDHRVLNVDGIMSGSALIKSEGLPIPKAAYDQETMDSTVVHGRNLLFAAMAVASTAGPNSAVYLGVHGGDHHLYPDCRPEFWENLNALVREAYGVEILTPFLNDSKRFIVAEGDSLAVPFDLTWSCYEGGEKHCGECGTCIERREAFSLAGVPDPTVYEETP